jgi:hypothetical protein
MSQFYLVLAICDFHPRGDLAAHKPARSQTLRACVVYAKACARARACLLCGLVFVVSNSREVVPSDGTILFCFVVVNYFSLLWAVFGEGMEAVGGRSPFAGLTSVAGMNQSTYIYSQALLHACMSGPAGPALQRLSQETAMACNPPGSLVSRCVSGPPDSRLPHGVLPELLSWCCLANCVRSWCWGCVAPEGRRATGIRPPTHITQNTQHARTHTRTHARTRTRTRTFTHTHTHARVRAEKHC